MIGRTISHYKILEELGESDAGKVYKAEDTKLGRTVTLKFLPADLTREQSTKTQIIYDVQAAAALQHQNICAIHEIDESEDGKLFVSMECFEGETLEEKVDSGPVPLEEALRLILDAAEGLTRAHASGVVHKNLTPANLTVTNDGVLKVLDFGLPGLESASKETRTGQRLTNVSYLSPEQVRGGEADARADVWALGAILYHLLAGKAPFAGDREDEILAGIVNRDPEPLDSRRGDLPRELVRILRRALDKDAQARYQTSAEFLGDLLGVYEPLRSEVEGPELKARPMRKARMGLRHPAVIAGVVLVAAVLFIVLKFLPGKEPSDPIDLTWDEPPLVVVTPFENRTGDASLDNVAALASEILARDLAGLDLLKTLPVGEAEPEASAGAKDRAEPDIIVSGAFYLEGDELQFQARVSEADRGVLISALPMIGGTREAPRVAIEQVSQRVMGALAMQLDNPFRQPIPSRPPTYEAFLGYNQALHGFDAEMFGGGSLMEAIGLWQEAAAQDTTFFRPLVLIPALLATMLGAPKQATAALDALEDKRSRMDDYDRLFADLIEEELAENPQEALRIAERLERMAPRDQLVKIFKMRACAALGLAHGFLETYDALDLTEDQERRMVFAFQARHAGYAYHHLGLYDKELEVRKRLIEYYPKLLLLRGDEMDSYAAMGKIDEIWRVVKECQQAAGGRGFLDYNLWGASRTLRAHGYREEAIELVNDYIEDRLAVEGEDLPPVFLAKSFYEAERWDESRAAFEEAMALDPEHADGYKVFFARIDARIGNRDAVERFLEGLEEKRAQVSPDAGPDRAELELRAELAALLGDRDRAVALLKEALDQGGGTMAGCNHNFDLESLHGYPPFEELIRPRD